MKNDIFGVAKNFLDVKANLKVESAAKKGSKEDITVSFMDYMGQNQMSSNRNISSDIQQTVVSNSKDSAAAAYDTYRDSSKNVSTAVEKAPEEILEEVSEPMEAYEEELRNIIKEELGVTDEQIDAALETLGLTMLDVKNVQDLAALVQTLTGEDIGTLFLSESFQNVMQQVCLSKWNLWMRILQKRCLNLCRQSRASQILLFWKAQKNCRYRMKRRRLWKRDVC